MKKNSHKSLNINKIGPDKGILRLNMQVSVQCQSWGTSWPTRGHPQDAMHLVVYLRGVEPVAFIINALINGIHA